MTVFELLLLAVALAMDCFTVSIVSGVIVRRLHWSLILKMAVLFGGFQALMLFLGWLGINNFNHYLEAFDHWIAFGLLTFVGFNMVKEAFSETAHFNPFALSTLLLLAVATSIDALAVGITFSCIGYANVNSLAVPLLMIGVVSFLFTILGNVLGVQFGARLTRRFKPDLIGGIILILIGVKILIEHLT